MTVFDLDTFFLKYNTGDIINDNYANAQCIINGVKVFKSKNAVKGTKFNSKQVEYSRSPENELKVNKCLKDGVIHDKNNIYFTREQMYILDPDFKKQCEENRRQQIIKFKFKK